ncbi:RHS repeat domain-containing protein [Flammeovirga aprica]|uniref:RHS repeat-associated core domain-containing protein n=1 Tax=Flammeovirga aprica JL-4 TaxID=694437 RepID=A0A7X9P317_9BACT|nr:RHS repeat-associated core domain-containing protein [Flammeovirga aprica]NME68500.1 hypothetical protein [Flammeovirga aprica JL-4]
MRDSSGNVMSIYKVDASTPAPKIKELPIYGSNRLGQHNGKGAVHQLASYKRIYEYANHLGNVLATTHDNGDILSLSDYFPFGLAMEDRSFQEADYRFGFNGKEGENAFNGPGDSFAHYDFGARIYDSRIGRFLSIDLLWKEYPFYSPYIYASDNPILLIDNNGEGPELPPLWVQAAITGFNNNFFNALIFSNNTSNAELYRWVKRGGSINDSEFRRFKGVFGEAIIYEKIRDRARKAQVSVMNSPVSPAIPTPAILGKRVNFGIPYWNASEGKLLQVDVTSLKLSGHFEYGPFLADIGFTVQHYNFAGNYSQEVPFLSKKTKWWRINYEVKALSSKNTVRNLYDMISKGIDQTISRSERSNDIGVLVVDKEAWEKVANDRQYGQLLQSEYERLTAHEDGKQKRFLQLEKDLSKNASNGVMGVKSRIEKADNNQ